MSQNLSTQIVCPSPKVWDFDEKGLHWASVVRAHRSTEVVKLGTSINAVRRFSAIFDLPTLPCPIKSDIFGLFCTPLPTYPKIGLIYIWTFLSIS